MDMIQANAEIDFVELVLEDACRIAVAIAASCTFISVTHECFSFREVEVLSGDLNPKLQYPGQIKASAHYAGNLDLLD